MLQCYLYWTSLLNLSPFDSILIGLSSIHIGGYSCWTHVLILGKLIFTLDCLPGLVTCPSYLAWLPWRGHPVVLVTFAFWCSQELYPLVICTPGWFNHSRLAKGWEVCKKTVPGPAGWWFALVKHHTLYGNANNKFKFSTNFIDSSGSQKLSRFKRARLALILLHSSCFSCDFVPEPDILLVPRNGYTGLPLGFFSTTSL